MTINDAYIRGLDDAEAVVITILTQLIKNEPLSDFSNPKLNDLKNALRIQLDYINGLANNPKSNIAKYARKEITKSLTIIEPVLE
jgi:hypothetical protein